MLAKRYAREEARTNRDRAYTAPTRHGNRCLKLCWAARWTFGQYFSGPLAALAQTTENHTASPKPDCSVMVDKKPNPATTAYMKPAGVATVGLVLGFIVVLAITFFSETRSPPTANSGTATPTNLAAQSRLPQCPSDKAFWTNCEGSRTFSDGSKYVGKFRDNKWNGQGTLTLPDGTKYVGEFRDGNLNGQVTLISPDGSMYVGEIRDNKPNGQGRLIWPDGKKYVGEYRDGKMSGQGTLSLPDGKKYVGEFRDGNMNGQGTIFSSDGSIIGSGIWENNKLAADGAMQRNARAVPSNTAVASDVSESADGAAGIILYSKHCGSISDKVRTGAATIAAVVGTDIMVRAMYQLELKRTAIGDSLFCSILKKSMNKYFE